MDDLGQSPPKRGVARESAACPGRPISMVVVACIVLLGCGGAGPALLLSAYESADDNPSDFWCGNRPRGGRDARCTGRATSRGGEVPSRMVEVRGWVVGAPGYNEGDNEIIFGLLLDHGWTPASPAAERVDPLNTVAKINAAITPHNVVSFGRGPSGEATAWLGDDAWGGPRGLVLHIEINGWGENPKTLEARKRQPPGPAGWVTLDDTPGVTWAFDPLRPPTVPGREVGLAEGDYVRMVGLLWEDTPHQDSDEGRTGADADRTLRGKRCWKSGRHDLGSNGRGFSELHPVDFMAELDPPQPSTDTLYVVVLCGESSLQRDIVPPGPRPAGARVAVEEFVDVVFTDVRGVARKTVTAMDDRVHLDIAVEPGSGPRAEPKFKAIYRVFWTQ